jgi:TonB family protein
MKVYSYSRPAGLVLAMLLAVVFSLSACGQENGSNRRLVERSAPVYPALARSMGLTGIVKIEAVVAPDGGVKSTEVKGGHPVLAQAAVNAVRKWRWEPAPHETRQTLEVKFEAQE